MAVTIKRTRCPVCAEDGRDTKSNNLAWFKNEQGQMTSKCMAGCKVERQSSDTIVVKAPTASGAANDIRLEVCRDFVDLLDRGITKETCELYNYQVGMYGNQKCQIANYENGAMHVRLPDKQFRWLNGQKETPLWGWESVPVKDDLKHTIIITEGQLDAMAVFQVTGNPALSLPGGIETGEVALKDVRLNDYTCIVLWMDNDAVGKEALVKYRDLLPEGKVFLIKDFNYKDANEALVAGDNIAIRHAIATAEEYVPDGISFGNSLNYKDMLEPEPEVIPFPFPRLNEKLRGGAQRGQFILLGAGSKIGKTHFMRTIAYHWRKTRPDLKQVFWFLEDNLKTTKNSFIALDNKTPLGLFDRDPLKYMTEEQYAATFKELIQEGTVIFPSPDIEIGTKSLIKHLTYLTKVKKADIIFLDHIHYVIGGEASSTEGERRDIDRLCHNIRQLCKQTGVIVIAAAHLSQPSGDGKDWEDGKQVKQRDYRGSGALRQLPDILLGLERCLQDPVKKDQLLIRVVGNRQHGETGEADTLYYIVNTGELVTIDKVFK